MSQPNPQTTVPDSDSIRFRIPPSAIVSAAIMIAFAVVIIIAIFATQPSWIGLQLTQHSSVEALVVQQSTGPSRDIPEGTALAAVSNGTDSMTLERFDGTVEPDGTMGTYDAYRRFIERQNQLYKIQGSPEIVFTDTSGKEYLVKPDLRGRPLARLPIEFWVQVIVGVVAWVISATIFAFRPREASARYLLLSGLATLIFAPCAATYTTRELGFPGLPLRWLSDLNFFGGTVFIASFVGLMLHYPRRIAPSWAGISIVIVYVGWFILQQLGFFESMTFARRFHVMVGVLTTFALAGVHWFLTRKDPVARALLQWFLLSWMVGTTLFALCILLPQMFGVDTSPVQGYAFLLFLLVYGGLAFGIMRFRLFDLGEWWRRIAVWTGALLLLVVLDLLFLVGLQLSTHLSLSLSLLICAVFWLPLRNWIWEKWMERPRIRAEQLFNKVMNVALAPHGTDQSSLWQQLLQEVFDPLGIQTDVGSRTSPVIENDGLRLRIPGVGTIPPVSMEYAHGGRRLFASHDVTLINELTRMLGYAMESRSAYEKGVAEERTRIFRDMHDNIGAQLLSALHSQDPSRKDLTIRETLTDLRNMINNPSPDRLSFEETLADLRMESAERLEAAGIRTRWQSETGGVTLLPPAPIHALRSIVREAVSNIIQHSRATQVNIQVHGIDDSITIEVSDDGKGIDSTAPQGNGLSNIRARVGGLNGQVNLSSNGNGTRLAASFPVNGKVQI